MENEQDPNTLGPVARQIPSLHATQEHTELDSKEQAALDEALLAAAEVGDTAAVASALDRGANIEALDDECSTALHVATWEGHLDMVRLLLDRGANIEAQDQEDYTALHAAAMFNRLHIIRLLLERCANINVQEQWGRTALDWASEKGHEEVIIVLKAHLAKLAKRELEVLEELQLVPPEINHLIINMGYGEGVGK